MRILLILLALTVTAESLALDIRIIPGERLYLNSTNPDKGYSDLVLHTVLIATGPSETVDVRELRIDLLAGGQTQMSKMFQVERLVGETQGIAQMVGQGLGVMLDAQVLSEGGIERIFGRKLGFASSPHMAPNEVLLIARQHFSLDFDPDTLRVSFSGVNKSGAGESVSADIDVERYQSPIVYQAPLRGGWLMTSLPSIHSHHRLNPPTEYAVDFFKVNAEGRIREGDALNAANYFGYGAEVLAAADGEVVFVIADEVQDRAAYLPRPGETLQQTGARLRFHNLRRYVADFVRAAAGNIVAVRHQNDGVVEYSSYGHLKAGSVRVKVGDIVRSGQIIAEVGDTGDSAAVHLHFQINNGAHPFYSRSLPVVFSDFTSHVGKLDPGRFVRKVD